jgi:hypothetical protein
MTNYLRRLPFTIDKTTLLLGVLSFNFLFVGVDVLMAHSENGFFRWALIPLVFSPIAVLAVLAVSIFRTSTAVRRTFKAVMWCGVGVGLAGTLFHLTGNATGGQDTLHRLLVQGSPTTEHYAGADRRSRLLVLVGLGFLGAVAAAFLDHGRVSFIPTYTLIPLVSGTVAALSCFYLAHDRANPTDTQIHLYVMGLSVVVGLVGFGFHVAGDLAGTESIVWARLLYRNPVLGPLLFCDLALLGALSIMPESLNRRGEAAFHAAGGPRVELSRRVTPSRA